MESTSGGETVFVSFQSSKAFASCRLTNRERIAARMSGKVPIIRVLSNLIEHSIDLDRILQKFVKTEANREDMFHLSSLFGVSVS